MKKLFLLTCLIIASIGLLSAATSPELYTLVVPEEYSTLIVEGGARSTPAGAPGTNVAWFELDTNNMTTDFELGISADYLMFRRTMDSLFEIDISTADVTMGANSLDFQIQGTATYKSYTLDFGAFKGFYGLGVFMNLWNMSFSFTGAPFALEIEPVALSGAIGIGRIHTVATIKRIMTMMDLLGLDANEETVRSVAEIMYKNDQYFNKFTDDFSQNRISYYQDLAAAMGVPDKALDLAMITFSQRFAFEVARYTNLKHGWEAIAQLTPMLYLDNVPPPMDTTFAGALILRGEYGGFLMDDKLHTGAQGGVELNYNPNNTTSQFKVIASAEGTVTWLPENYRLWANGTVNVQYDTGATTDNFSFGLTSRLNYLINPNFSVYGGLAYQTGSAYAWTQRNKLSVSAGGRIRIW